MLSATNVPSFNYWIFSVPRQNRYDSLCVQPQCVDAPANNYGPKTNYKQSESKNTCNLVPGNERFKNVIDEDLEVYIQEQENKNTSRKTKSVVKIFKTFLNKYSRWESMYWGYSAGWARPLPGVGFL